MVDQPSTIMRQLRNSMSDLDNFPNSVSSCGAPTLTTSVSAISSTKPDQRTNNSCTTKSTTSGTSSNSESHYQAMEDDPHANPHFQTNGLYHHPHGMDGYSTLMVNSRYYQPSYVASVAPQPNQATNRWKWLLTRLRKPSTTSSSSSSTSSTLHPRLRPTPRVFGGTTLMHPTYASTMGPTRCLQATKRDIIHLGPTQNNFVLNAKHGMVTVVQDSPNLSTRSEQDGDDSNRRFLNGQMQPQPYSGRDLIMHASLANSNEGIMQQQQMLKSNDILNDYFEPPPPPHLGHLRFPPPPPMATWVPQPEVDDDFPDPVRPIRQSRLESPTKEGQQPQQVWPW